MQNAVLLLLLCLLPACTLTHTEQKEQLATFQRTAKYYYDGAKYGQALGQIERGLEIEPDDYMLNALQGAILLQTSDSAIGTDHKQLDAATAQLEKVFAWRSANRHEPFLLSLYALARQKQGRRHLGEAMRLRDQATRAVEGAEELVTQADEEQRLAEADLTKAAELLLVLVERGDLRRLSYYHLLQIAFDLRDTASIDYYGPAYLEQVAKEQEFAQKEIERTPTLQWEREQTEALKRLRTEEILVRSLLANSHFDRKQYAEALPHLDRVLDLDPSRSVDYYNRGRVLLELGRRDDAKADFRKFLATTNLPASSDKATLALQALGQ